MIKKLLFLILALLLVSPILASAYMFTSQDYNPYYTKHYGPYHQSYYHRSYYRPYQSSFYTGGYNRYYGTYGYYYNRDPAWKYYALDSFFR